MALILASQSPRRKELLGFITENFTVRVSDAEEITDPLLSPEETVKALAVIKGEAVAADFPDDVIISADTIVVLDNKILGKPHSEEEACEMISTLSGAKHKVVTGVTLRTADRTVSFSAESLVSFRELEAEEVNYYVEKYRPMDKAGAYGIQEWIGYIGIEGIEGSFYNVMGLPTQRLYTALKEIIK